MQTTEYHAATNKNEVVVVLSFSCSVMSDFFATSWTVACQVPLSMGFPRQEYWSRLPFSSPGDLPNPGIRPQSPELQADSLPSEPPGESLFYFILAVPCGLWDLSVPTRDRTWTTAVKAPCLDHWITRGFPGESLLI